MNALCLRGFEGSWEKTWQGSDERGFLLRKGRRITCVMFVGMLPLQNVGILIIEA